MADIKQAAKWIDEGKRVMRPGFEEELAMFKDKYGHARFGYEGIKPVETFFLDVHDLLADDWEIAE